MKSRVEVLRETHETPEWASERLRRIGGLNRFGDPNYRVVWGWNRLGWVGGKFEDRDEEGNLIREVLDLRRMPKYPNVNRWLVEQWLPPEKYGTPETWNAQTREWGEEGNIPQLGPYPAGGDYELLSILETPGGEFVQLSLEVLDDVIALVREQKKKSYQESLAARKEGKSRQLRKDAQYGHEYLNEQAPAISGKEFVTVL